MQEVYDAITFKISLIQRKELSSQRPEEVLWMPEYIVFDFFLRTSVVDVICAGKKLCFILLIFYLLPLLSFSEEAGDPEKMEIHLVDRSEFPLITVSSQMNLTQ